ncbi:MAG: hypothetical protein ACXIUQ_01545 [Cecembia sp.]
MKRKLSIWFLFLAQIIMLGHNFIPHHHHDPFETFSHPEHHCSHHEHSDVQGLLAHMFSLVPHSEKGMEPYFCTHSGKHFTKELPAYQDLLHNEIFLQKRYLIQITDIAPFVWHGPKGDDHFSFGLRGPPFTV